jgi:hypothetical protein
MADGIRNGMAKVRCSKLTKPLSVNKRSITPGAPSEKIPGCPGAGASFPAWRSKICMGFAINALAVGLVKTTTATLPPGLQTKSGRSVLYLIVPNTNVE